MLYGLTIPTQQTIVGYATGKGNNNIPMTSRGGFYYVASSTKKENFGAFSLQGALNGCSGCGAYSAQNKYPSTSTDGVL